MVVKKLYTFWCLFSTLPWSVRNTSVREMMPTSFPSFQDRKAPDIVPDHQFPDL